MEMIDKYSIDVINKHANLEIIRKVDGDILTLVDDLLCTIAPLYVFMDWTTAPNPAVGSIQWSIKKFMQARSKFKFQDYSREDLEDLFRNEWITELADKDKETMLLGFKLISGIDSNGKLILNEKLHNAYLTIQDKKHTKLPFGKKSVSRIRQRGVTITFNPKPYMDGYQRLLSFFKSLLESDVAVTTDGERFKWVVADRCKSKSIEQIVEIAVSCSPSQLFVWNWRNQENLKLLLKDYYDETLSAIIKLCTSEEPLSDRFADFKEFSKKKGRQLDERTASIILTCYDSSQYAFYINTCYTRLCKFLGISARSAGEAYEHYLRILEPVMKLIEKDSLFMNQIIKCLGYDATTLSLAQNIVFVILYKYYDKI